MTESKLRIATFLTLTSQVAHMHTTILPWLRNQALALLPQLAV